MFFYLNIENKDLGTSMQKKNQSLIYKQKINVVNIYYSDKFFFIILHKGNTKYRWI